MVEKIKVFDGSDEKLKILGELLSNDTSRKIIRILINNEMYTNEIVTKLDLSISLVIHHLRKLEELGLLEVSQKKIVKKGNDHKYYKMTPSLVIFPGETDDTIEEKGILKKFFSDGIKLVSIALTSGVSWWLATLEPVMNKDVNGRQDTAEQVSYSILPEYLIPIMIICCGLFLFFYKKK